MPATLNGPYGKMMLGLTSLRIGQAQNNQLVVNDSSVSSNHAEIRPEGQSYSITDLGSTSGTFVNEQRLPAYTSRLLNTGDTIRVGNTVFIYEMSAASPYGATA